MAGYFGTTNPATSYVETTTETPKWMQDAIYNQIQWATNISQMPYQAYGLPTVAELTPYQQQAYQNIAGQQGAWQPEFQRAQAGMGNIAGAETAGGLQQAQSQYLQPGLAGGNLQAGQQMLNKAGGMDITGAATPYLGQAGAATAQALGGSSMGAANPYMQAASQSGVGGIQQYMNPYQQGVLDVIAKQGARNLQENLLPSVSDAFIKAGQFGSSRMGDIGSRALRDTQEAILEKQSQAAQQGYGQALQASQADLARQAQLAGTAGQISGTDLARQLQGAQQYGTLGQMAGQLTGQQMSTLANIGQAQTAAGQAQQQYGLQAAQALQGAQSADLARQQSALSQMAGLAQQGQQMRTADTAALEAAGAAQQQNMQQMLNAGYNQWMQEQNYPRQTLDWLSTQVRGMAPITPTTQYQTAQQAAQSPLSQVASGLMSGAGLYNLLNRAG